VKRTAVVLLLLAAACGKDPDPEPDPANPPGYGTWKYRNFILGQTFSGGGKLPGTIDIDPGLHAGGPIDWIEVAFNGNTLGRHPTGSGSTRIRHEVQFRPGANWIRFFSSASRLGWEFQIDTHSGTRFSFTPKDKVDWDMDQQKDE